MHWIDPDSLPEIIGTHELFLINHKGQPDGLILADGREVHFPPHMGEAVVAAWAKDPKAPLRIRGVKPRGAEVFAAVSVQVGDGPRLEDGGPPEKPHKPAKPGKADASCLVSGEVRKPLHGPRGERRGLLLRSGEIVRFPPHAADEIAPFLKAGARVVVEGRHLRTPLGEVIEATLIGADEDNLHRLHRRKPHDD